MTVTHNSTGRLDTTSSELIVANRLTNGDYTIAESDELQLTALEAIRTGRRPFQPLNGADYWVLVHPETGEVHLSGEVRSFRRPAFDVELGVSVTRLSIDKYSDARVEVNMKSHLSHDVRGLSDDFETLLKIDCSGDKTLLEFLKTWLTTITRHLQTGELVQGLRVHDHLPF